MFVSLEFVCDDLLGVVFFHFVFSCFASSLMLVILGLVLLVRLVLLVLLYDELFVLLVHVCVSFVSFHFEFPCFAS